MAQALDVFNLKLLLLRFKTKLQHFNSGFETIMQLVEIRPKGRILNRFAAGFKFKSWYE